MDNAKFKIWWIPQIPMEAFERDVPNYETGKMLCDTLADYDIFQFENNIKPDYCNMGGVMWRHPEKTDGEWWDLEDEEAEELGLAVAAQ